MSSDEDLFGRFGNDSLSSLKLANLVKDKLGKEISVHQLLNGEKVTLDDLSRMIEGHRVGTLLFLLLPAFI